MVTQKKRAFTVSFVLAMSLIFFGCDNGGGGNKGNDNGGGKKDTYYLEMGGISEKAWNLIEPKMSYITAEEAVSYCHAYIVSGDIYSEAESRMSRKELEQALDDIGIGNKVQFLRSLDNDGAVWGSYKVDDDKVFLYAEKE